MLLEKFRLVLDSQDGQSYHASNAIISKRRPLENTEARAATEERSGELEYSSILVVVKKYRGRALA